MSPAVTILRPANLGITLAALLLAFILGGGRAISLQVAASFAATLFLVAGFYVTNDIADRQIDRIAHPRRPIPSGRLSVAAASRIAVLLIVAAFAAGFLGVPGTMGVLLAWAIALGVYEVGIKDTGAGANVLVSAVSSSALLFGAYLGGDWVAGVAPALFAFLLHLGREITKDICDTAGDLRGKRRTIPVSFGKGAALKAAASVLAALVLLSPLPFVIGLYRWPYLLIVIAGVDAVIVFGLVRAFSRDSSSGVVSLPKLLKSGMWLGMAAMLFGSIQ